MMRKNVKQRYQLFLTLGFAYKHKIDSETSSRSSIVESNSSYQGGRWGNGTCRK